LKIQTEFERHLPANAQTISYGSNIEMYNQSSVTKRLKIKFNELN